PSSVTPPLILSHDIEFHHDAGRPRRHRRLPASVPVRRQARYPREKLEVDGVRLRLPWDPSNTTLGDMVHGGAIATLADLTVMAAAWCGADAPESLRGVTVSMALEYLAPAQ